MWVLKFEGVGTALYLGVAHIVVPVAAYCAAGGREMLSFWREIFGILYVITIIGLVSFLFDSFDEPSPPLIITYE